ncbi:MAG: hypothetical protein WBD41_20235, partial [Rhodococcus sp. (in: high G+C Gram-positive bacteria)]
HQRCPGAHARSLLATGAQLCPPNAHRSDTFGFSAGAQSGLSTGPFFVHRAIVDLLVREESAPEDVHSRIWVRQSANR